MGPRALEVGEHVARHRRGEVGLARGDQSGHVGGAGAVERQRGRVGELVAGTAEPGQHLGVEADRLHEREVSRARDRLGGEFVARVDRRVGGGPGRGGERLGVAGVGRALDGRLEGLVQFPGGGLKRRVGGRVLEVLVDRGRQFRRGVDLAGRGEQAGVADASAEQQDVQRVDHGGVDAAALGRQQVVGRLHREVRTPPGVAGGVRLSRAAEVRFERLVVPLVRRLQLLVCAPLARRPLEAGEHVAGDAGGGAQSPRGGQRDGVGEPGAHRVPLGRDGDRGVDAHRRLGFLGGRFRRGFRFRFGLSGGRVIGRLAVTAREPGGRDCESRRLQETPSAVVHSFRHA
ncbi:hypothetical protein BN996_01766 [Haloferax massiliensis]|uniref:Uncharacterized protein n=1 Tax=Haloferax massiliensis TaxID=1476858 RepID=A0A0D6JR03_9EURY|nr:hypothetical protein BN996_01766 [Haloferax massiliensis]